MNLRKLGIVPNAIPDPCPKHIPKAWRTWQLWQTRVALGHSGIWEWFGEERSGEESGK